MITEKGKKTLKRVRNNALESITDITRRQSEETQKFLQHIENKANIRSKMGESYEDYFVEDMNNIARSYVQKMEELNNFLANEYALLNTTEEILDREKE